MTKKRPHSKTALSLAPLTVDEALSALLKTPPPNTSERHRKLKVKPPKAEPSGRPKKKR